MSKLKLGLLIGLIFVAGVAAGVVGTRLVIRHLVQRALTHPELVRNRIERELKWKLHLDASQQAQVEKILEDSQSKIQGIRKEVQPQFLGVINEAATNISAVLTPEQQARFEKLREEHRRMFGGA